MTGKKEIEGQKKNPYLKPNGSFDLIDRFPIYEKKRLKKAGKQIKKGDMNKMKWIKKWHIKSENSNREYVVSLSDEDTWGCSCPAWKFRRQGCKHIKRVKLNPERYEEIRE